MKEEVRWSDEEKLASYLVNEVNKRASGSKYVECLGNSPRDVYFIGNLRPRDNASSDDSSIPKYLKDLSNKLSPVAFGAEFLLNPFKDMIEINITLSWSLYYRVIPTFDQQRRYQLKEDSKELKSKNVDTKFQMDDDKEENQGADNDEEFESADLIEARKKNKDTLIKRFKKISCKSIGYGKIYKDDRATWQIDFSNLIESINLELERGQNIVFKDTERFKTNGEEDDNVKLPQSALIDEEEFENFLSQLKTDVIPKWSIEPRFEIKQEDSEGNNRNINFLAEFTNISNIPSSSNNKEGYIFEPQASFEFLSGEVVPFELDLAPKNFRYDRNLWGRGFNCGIEVTSGENGRNKFVTTNIPIFRQRRMVTKDTPKITFHELTEDPITKLEVLLNAMNDYISVWNEEEKSYRKEFPNWDKEFRTMFNSDLEIFKDEIGLFKQGIQALKENKDILKAFILTNTTFEEAGRRSIKKKDSWRLFQIVFLVSQIPSIESLGSKNTSINQDRDTVDIIYYPTGGGKTEAYLSVTIMQIFFDRLRGKSAGVSVWTRFPLRLLTLQQMQRFADIVGTAELVRLRQSDERLNGKNVDGFAVGYFVGKGSSPNEICEPTKGEQAEDAVNWSIANDENSRQKWKKIVRCPSCQTYSVKVDFVVGSRELVHRCENSTCSFLGGRIPVYIVDNEIYRFLPSVMVGTIDKLASIGNQRKMALLFGQVDGKCSVHGYYKIKCCQKDCNNSKLILGAPKGVSAPTLFIQDELHLLKEGLGTFDSHYETFLQRLYLEFGQRETLKIIASTATIEAYDRQVEHLYGRKRARIFPGFGPTLGTSFYTNIVDVSQRIYVGIIPHNKTIFNSILQLIRIYHEVIQELQKADGISSNPYGGIIEPNSTSWKELLNNYDVSLVYFNSVKELTGIHNDLDNAIDPELESENYRPLSVVELTGNTTSDVVSTTLEKLESQKPEDESDIDTVLATNMISHGVDIDRLNAMIFYGMPRQVGEYIQSSSRVGRSHSGVIFNCLHPARERDQSNYLYFGKQHEFLGRMVEPVAINRWSKFSLQRTLPGLFMSILLQIIANRNPKVNPNLCYRHEFVRKMKMNGEITANDFIPILEDAYLSSMPSGVNYDYFKEEIRTRVNGFLDQISNPISRTGWVSDVLFPKPMSSLRDVDESIEIELDDRGSSWGGS
ncbi:MAG: hypothetical protein B2I17_00105 [Thermoplasmatales archaeon B_DKE]|nr:MAG: hypothetical protein B2I17_00105 [Thermoplasmatales archaeon B_DKE]